MDILIIDDSGRIRKVLKKVLASIEGVDAIREADGLESGEKELKKNKSDILILDIFFPEGTGLDLLKIVQEQNSGAKVIMMTNFPIERLMERSFEAGADYFFDKSKDIYKLVKTVRQIVGSSSIS